MTASAASALGLAVAVAALGFTACTAVPDGGESQRARIVRVVDGDTIVVNYDDAEHRVRLLNVDTPETVQPGQPVQCLGPEATAFLQDRLPVGAPVVLRFDEERLDRYDRELAGVFDAEDALVNADIARAGLGIAVLYEPNRRFYRDVLAAQKDAERRRIGRYSAELDCAVGP